MIEQVEHQISEINKLHILFFEGYSHLQKVNLSQPFSKVLTDAILAYRLNLHESINDYLMAADLDDIKYFYRVKTSESILNKIERFSKRQEGYPVNSILNDIFGARIILDSADISQVMESLDGWQEKIWFEELVSA